MQHSGRLRCRLQSLFWHGLLLLLLLPVHHPNTEQHRVSGGHTQRVSGTVLFSQQACLVSSGPTAAISDSPAVHKAMCHLAVFYFFYSLLMNSVLCSSLNVITRPLPPQLIAVLIKSPVLVFIRRRGLFSSNAEVWVLPRRELFTLQ